jgi:hypothetical protein
MTVLHGKIISDGSGTIPDKIERPRKASAWKQVME